MDLRCRGKKHAELFEDEVLEVKCDSRICKEGDPQRVVLHRFNTRTGQLIETVSYKEPLSKGA